MSLPHKKSLKYFFVFSLIASATFALASTGTISSSHYIAQVCEDVSCTVSSTSPVNFGYFTSTPSSNVTVTDTELTGFIWGKSFGWAVLNCSNTVSGCSSNNGNFKVANDGAGHLSGYAWGQNSGWINFGPFANSATAPISINSSGQFNGYAWSQNYGWIKFDCSNSNYCVTTSWRSSSTTPVAPPTTPPGHPTTPPTTTPPVTPPVTPPTTTPPVTPPTTTPPVTPPTTTPPVTPTSVIPSVNPNVIPGIIKEIQTNISSGTHVVGQPNTLIRTISTTGAISGISFSLATAIFANPLAFSELFLIPIRIWNLIMAALGFKRRGRPWGTVYDGVTKQPLDPAYVILQDLQGNEVATCITDLDGRYGFLVPPGTYKMIAHKTNYDFPSKKLEGKSSDELYQDLYFGDTVVIKEEGDVILKNIPMDPIKFDWNEFAKKEQNLMKFYSPSDLWIARICDFLFAFGFIVTLIAITASASTYNIIVLCTYILLFILKRTILRPRPFGGIKHKDSNIPLSFAVLRVYLAGTDHEFTHKVADKSGRYYCLVPNGSYYVKIEKKNEDASYNLVYTSDVIDVKNGYINTMFEL